MPPPPPLPAVSSSKESYRDFSLPPHRGEELDVFLIAECTPDKLRFSVNAGCMLAMAIGGAVVAAIAFPLWWWLPGSQVTVYSNAYGAVLTTAIVATIISIGSLVNLGRSMSFDRLAHTARVTWFFFRTREYRTDRFKAISLEIAAPAATAPTAANQGAATPPPTPAVANRVAMTVTGIDEQGQPIKISFGSTTLSSKKEWPVMAAVARHLCTMFHLPLHITGATDQVSDVAKEQLAQIVAWATSP